VQAEATKDSISKLPARPAVVVKPLPKSDPADLDGLLAACGRLLDEVLPQGGAGTVAVCATSGTPQLSLALTLAVSALRPDARHFQALDPSSTGQFWREFNPDALRHHTELEAGFKMLASCRFEEAAELLERRRKSAATEARARRPAIEAALAVTTALAKADALSPSEAHAALNVGVAKLPEAAARSLGSLKEWYKSLKDAQGKNPRWPVELAARAAREKAAGRIPQALVAAAIAFEAALTVRLRASHGLDPDRLSTRDRERLPNADECRELKPGAYRLEGAERRSAALAAIDEEYERLHDDARREPLLETRNKLVHSAKAPSDTAVDDALAFLEDLCGAFGWPSPSECPSAPDALAKLVRDLRRAAGLGE